MMKTGMLVGVGTGPGDPELITLKALRILREADVIAFFSKAGNQSNARKAVAPHLRPGTPEIALEYPVTTECDKNGVEYKQQISTFYAEAAERLESELKAGRTIALLSEGDPLFYGSYMHLHARLASSYPTRVVPGITAMSGCWSEVGVPIAQGDDILSVLPGTLPEDRLVAHLRNSEAVVIMKVGRNLPKIRRSLMAAGRLKSALYVERGTLQEGYSIALIDKPDDDAPYFSLVLVPGWEVRS